MMITMDNDLVRSLIDSSLPELHKAHWAQHTADLETAIEQATSPAEQAELERLMIV